MNPTIEIIVKPNGESRVETKGFSGTDCQAASRFLRQALGSQSAEQLKSEFYQQSSVAHRQAESQ